MHAFDRIHEAARPWRALCGCNERPGKAEMKMATRPRARRSILPVLVRRVNRVQARAAADNTVDEILDDIFVLWRAYEATFEPGGKHRERAENAALSAIAYEGVRQLPQLLEWGRSLKRLEFANAALLTDWFSDTPLNSVQAEHVRARVNRVAVAAGAPDRWHEQDSRRLATVLYDIRCAVFHASLETNAATAYEILAPLRRGMVDLIMARAALIDGITIAATRAHFDANAALE